MGVLKRLGFSAILLLLALLVIVSPANADDGTANEKLLVKIDPTLLRELDAPPDGSITFLVYLGSRADLTLASTLAARAERGTEVYASLRAHADRTQAGIRAYLDAAQFKGRVRTYTSLWIVNGLSVTADASVLWDLAARDEVQRIVPEREYVLNADSGPGLPHVLDSQRSAAPSAVEWNIAQINADDVWATHGVTGTGVLVANIDSGVMYNHAALLTAYAGDMGAGFDHNYHWFDATRGRTIPYDDNGHGTHTMGTILGDDAVGNQIGVAPGARWIAVKAFDAAGSGSSTDLHEAFQWVLAPCDSTGQNCDPARAPRIVSNSWGSRDGSRTEFLPDVQALRAAGIWPVFSAGNSGPAAGTAGSPGSFAESFAVGATNSRDQLATFSSRGPSPLTPEVKPDVVAPGVEVRSALNDGGYGQFSGTSMACPHVAGLGALLLSAEPSLALDQMEDLITTTAMDLGNPGPDMAYGYGRIDALEAVQRLLSSGHLTGVIRDASADAPIPFAEVNVRGAGYDLAYTANASGVYSATYLAAGTYTVTASHYGYKTGAVSGVMIVTDTVTVQDLDLTLLPTHTLSGVVTEAGTGVPLTATVRVLGTPVPPVATDANGFYSIVVAQGAYDVEAHSFGHATGLQHIVVDQDRVLNFALDPLPPILLVDDDEGDLRDYSPHVQDYFLSALEANDYNFTYWDIEVHGQPPDFDTLRQYAAVVWFGGEFGRIKDISDADQAQAVMDYLDLGGRLFYTAQEHTFYYGDDAVCDTDPSACPFTYSYLRLDDFAEDRKAETVNGVAGDPVGDGLGPYNSQFPPFERDFADKITPGVGASAAFTASSTLDPDHIIAHTYYSATHGYKVVFMAYPFEALPPIDAADVMVRIMDWFGVRGPGEGVALAPAFQRQTEPPGSIADYVLRVRNLNAEPEIYSLTVLSTTLGWPTEIMDAEFTTAVTELGPVAPGGTADFGLRVQIPSGATPGAFDLTTVEVRTQSLPAFSDVGQAATHARMTYYVLDNDACGTGVHLNWVDATGGERHDIGGAGEPTFFSTTLPLPFTFYNQSYDHVYVNECGSLVFGDDNIYDDCRPTADPPIPQPTILDPNNAIHAHWGSFFWNPGRDPDQAVYTWHETSDGRDWFVIEWHHWDNLLSGSDTFETILDLDTNEIIMQYLTTTHVSYATAGIENAFGTEGVLYVWDNQPAENQLHNRLAVKYGVGSVPEVNEVLVLPRWNERTIQPGGVVTYLLAISNTSSISDTFILEAKDANWTTTFWDSGFAGPLSDTGPMESCTTLDVGARVEVPADALAFRYDRALLGARSQRDTLVFGSALVTTTVAAHPAVDWTPKVSYKDDIPGRSVPHVVEVRNLGNLDDRYALSALGRSWNTTLWDGSFTRLITQTALLAPGQAETVGVRVTIPSTAETPDLDAALLRATSNFTPLLWSDALLVTRVSRPAPGDYGVSVTPSSRLDGGPLLGLVTHDFTVTNEGAHADTFDLVLRGAAWPSRVDGNTDELAPGGSETVEVTVRVPITARGDWDRVTLLVTSRADPRVQDAVTAVTVSLGGEPPWQRVYLPLLFKAHP